MSGKSRKITLAFAKIRPILRAEWNPIGFDVPPDEYDSCIPVIYRLLSEGADRKKLSDHLLKLETSSIGLVGDPQRRARTAEALLQLHLNK